MTTAPAAALPPYDLPRAPKVLGILSIVFASIVLLGGLLTTCGGLAGRSVTRMELEAGGIELGIDRDRLDPGVQREIFDAVKDTLGSVYTLTAVTGAAFTIMSAWLLALGIGQVGYRRWARGQTVVWSVVGIAVLVGFVALSTAVIGPAYDSLFELAQRHAPRDVPLRMSFDGMGSFAGATASIFVAALLLPYPIVLLAFFRRESVKQAMAR